MKKGSIVTLLDIRKERNGGEFVFKGFIIKDFQQFLNIIYLGFIIEDKNGNRFFYEKNKYYWVNTNSTVKSSREKRIFKFIKIRPDECFTIIEE